MSRVDRQPALAGALVQAGASLLALVATDGVVTVLLPAGVVGGVVAGGLTDRYGPALRNGATAGFGGAALVALAGVLAGLAAGLEAGLGLAGALASGWTFYSLSISLLAFVLLAPVLAIEGMAAAILANRYRPRRRP